MKLRVWWIPQVPMKPFFVSVESIKEARKILDTLAKYDLFQLENKIKPNYTNAGSLEVYDETTKKWVEWICDICGEDIDNCECEEVK